MFSPRKEWALAVGPVRVEVGRDSEGIPEVSTVAKLSQKGNV